MSLRCKEVYLTVKVSSLNKPSLAASCFALFFELPRPEARHWPSHMARTIHIGVALVPSPFSLVNTHSMNMQRCWRRWLKRARCPWLDALSLPLVQARGGGTSGGGDVLIVRTGSAGRPCALRTKR